MHTANFIFLAAVVLLLQAAAPGVHAAATCNGAVCSGKSNTILNNGVTYCCPATDVTPSASYADPSTYACPTTQSCSQCAWAIYIVRDAILIPIFLMATVTDCSPLDYLFDCFCLSIYLGPTGAAGNIGLANSTFCMDIPGASMVDGTRLGLWSPCGASDAETFVFSSTDYTIRPRAAPNMCLEGAPQDSVWLLLKTCSSANVNQQFDVATSGAIVMHTGPRYGIALNLVGSGNNPSYPAANGVQLIVNAVSPQLRWTTSWTSTLSQSE
jgi:hypothetical protein